jgi:hypothetical protein
MAGVYSPASSVSFYRLEEFPQCLKVVQLSLTLMMNKMLAGQ